MRSKIEETRQQKYEVHRWVIVFLFLVHAKDVMEQKTMNHPIRNMVRLYCLSDRAFCKPKKARRDPLRTYCLARSSDTHPNLNEVEESNDWRIYLIMNTTHTMHIPTLFVNNQSLDNRIPLKTKQTRWSIQFNSNYDQISPILHAKLLLSRISSNPHHAPWQYLQHRKLLINPICRMEKW